LRPLTAAELLQIWEDGLDQPLYHKSAMLLVAACAPADWDTVVQWPVGRRDGLLLQLRQAIFGTNLENTAFCPGCSEQVEWEMKTTHLLVSIPLESREIPVFTLDSAPFNLRFRLPNTQDFFDKTALQHPFQLTRNCILGAEKNGTSCAAVDLPDKVLQEVDNRMEAEDPQANLTFQLQCPSCQQLWENVFDIMTYLWIEIDNWAKHLLQEVFVLARAFGWSERDIISMSSTRRQFYLEMLRT
jgi:hypothetical protein